MPMPPRSSWLLLWILLTAFIGFTRFSFRDFLLIVKKSRHKKVLRVAIYGAGQAGVQLASSLRIAGNHEIVSFVDDNPRLWNRRIYGVPVEDPNCLSDIAVKLDQVLLAIPSLTFSDRKRILLELQNRGLSVLQVPSIDDITSGRAKVDALRPIVIDDLLGRQSVPPDPTLLGPGITGCVVCVTGAGGSIGSELCRQIVPLNPAHLVLIERSEPSLYAIQSELMSIDVGSTTIHSFLGDWRSLFS